MNHLLKSDRGMTLIEVLIALLMTGILTAAMFRVYVNQHHAWMIQDRVIEMQQNARAAADELSRQLRMAGYELPNNLAPIEAYNTNPDTIAIHYQSASCNATLKTAMTQPTSVLDCSGAGADLSCLYDGQLAYIFDPNVERGEFFTISHIQASPGSIQHSSSALSKNYPAGSLVLAIDRIKYYINRSDTLHPKLMVQLGSFAPEVYAEDIVNLQFTYTMKNGDVVDVPAIAKDVRAIGITVRSRTPQKDVEFTATPYRFETYQSRVYLRNMGT